MSSSAITVRNKSRLGGLTKETRPDYVMILPWNLKDEITQQMTYIGEWGGQFVVPIPEVRLYSVPVVTKAAARG